MVVDLCDGIWRPQFIVHVAPIYPKIANRNQFTSFEPTMLATAQTLPFGGDYYFYGGVEKHRVEVEYT
jgi:hypothetical protein